MDRDLYDIIGQLNDLILSLMMLTIVTPFHRGKKCVQL